MSLQEQINTLKKQIETSLNTLNKLSAELEHSDSPSQKPISQNSNKALLGYLALGSNIQDDAFLSMILQSAMYVVNANGAGLTLLDPETNKLVFKAAIGDGAEDIIGYQVPLNDSQHGLAFATGEIQSSTPINTDIENSTNVEFKNVLVAPLFINDEGVGTISAVNKKNGGHFTPEDMQAYKHFADLAALVIRQHQREKILKDTLAGKKNNITELDGINFNEDDQQFMSILEDVAKIAKQQDNLLPLCKKLTELLADMSDRNKWS